MYSFRIISVFDKPIIIEGQEQAVLAIKHFIADYKLSNCRQLLWNLLETALTKENDYFGEPEHRDEIFTFVRNLEELIEAIHLLPKIKLV